MSPRTPRSAAGVAASTTWPLTASAAGSSAAASQRTCGWAVKPSPSTGAAMLSAVAVTSPKDVWAVGNSNVGGAFKTLIEHWDGAHRKIVRSPNPASGLHTTNTLGAVVALTPKNAWAFGFFEKATTSFRTLIEHWDGKSGPSCPARTAESARTPCPAPPPGAAPTSGRSDTGTIPLPQDNHRTLERREMVDRHGARASEQATTSPLRSRSDRTACVGRRQRTVSFGETLALRWNGKTWTRGRTANPGGGDCFLFGVAVPGARRARGRQRPVRQPDQGPGPALDRFWLVSRSRREPGRGL